MVFRALLSWLSNGFGLMNTFLAHLYRRLLLLTFLYPLLLGLRPAVCGSRDELFENLFFPWSHNLLRLCQVILSDCEVRVRMIPVIVLDHNQSVDVWILISGVRCALQICVYASAD